MASRLMTSPAIQATAKRQMATQAAAVARSDNTVAKAEPLKVSTLKNGLTVAALETHGPLTTLGVVLKAGARNETYDNLGASHMLRIAAGLSTKNHTTFGITKNLQQAGTGLSCTQGREHTVYMIQTTRDNTDLAVDYLTDVVSNQVFKPWELGDSLPRLKLELAHVSKPATAMELLHQAAFRTGLGNSLYCAPHRVGAVSTAQLQQFVAKHFTTGRAALVGVGVSQSNLEKFGELINLEAGAGPSSVGSKFCGGEVRVETGGPLAYVALAAPAPGATSVKDALATMLLQRVLGHGCSVKYGGGQGQLVKAASAASAADQAVSAICPMYSDGGLLGAMIICEGASAGKTVAAVAAALRSASVTEAEVAGAKKKLLADAFTMLENPASLVEDIGTQVLMAGDVVQASKLPELINGVSVADVQAAAKKLSSSKLAMGATGNLSTVPYLDSL